MRPPRPKNQITVKHFVSKVRAKNFDTMDYEWTWTATCIAYDEDEVKIWSRKVPNLKTRQEVDEMLELLQDGPDFIPGRQVLFF